MATPTMRDTLAETYMNNAGLASLHTASPGDTGANMLAIPRVWIIWNDTGVGQLTSNVITFQDVPAGSVITHVGIWNFNGDSFKDSVAIEATTFPSAGVLEITLTYTQA